MDRRTFITSGIAASALGSTAPAPTKTAAASLGPALSFHSNFWVNLHHRLYRQSVATVAVKSGERLRDMAPQLYADLSHLSSTDRTDWDAAMVVYERHYAAKDLLFDEGLSSYFETLSGIESSVSASLNRSKLPITLISALHSAAPVYARTYWPEDNLSNVRWIAAAMPLLDRFRRPFTKRLSKIFATSWRPVPYRDDVVRYSNWAEAYTEDERYCVYCAIGSASPGNAGRASLETIFHEASHSLVFPDYGTVADAINSSAKAARREPPDQFWHAVIFYTAGRLAQDLYNAAGEPGYEMFADAAGLWRGDWSSYRPALKDHWEPYMAGRGTLRSALSKSVTAVFT